MAVIKLQSNLQLQVRYLLQQDGRFYYQRRIPTNLRDRYPGRSIIKRPLRARTVPDAVSEVAAHAASDDAKWLAMRGDDRLGSAELQHAALGLLADHGLDPGMGTTHPVTDRLVDSVLEQGRVDLDTFDSRKVNAVEWAAFQALKQRPPELLSMSLRHYLDNHKRAGDPEFVRVTKRDWARLIGIVGDIPTIHFTREHARQVRDAMYDDGNKTTSVRRRLNGFRAVFAAIRRETESEKPNPFEALTVAGLGNDTEKRQPFSGDELLLLVQRCRALNDERRRLITMLAFTGMRLAEAAGLAISDLVLNHDIPHIVIQPHPWRSLKTSNSRRLVPLVGDALTAARSIVHTAQANQSHAFPTYCNSTTVKSNSASATLNKWIKSQVGNLTLGCHSLRHTMRDRLRDAGAPKDIIDAIGGWSMDGIGESYGKGHALQTKQRYLQAAYQSVFD